MDLTPYIAPLATAVLSIGAVSAFFTKYISKVIKYVKLAADAVNTLEHLAESLEDGALTPMELDQLKKDIAKFKSDL